MSTKRDERAGGRASDAEPEGTSAWRASALAPAFLVTAPLLAAYELALARRPDLPRSSAELLVGSVLRPLGEAAAPVRRALLAALVLLALVSALRKPLGLVPRLARQLGEGALGALALGPVLALLVALAGLGHEAARLGGAPPLSPPSLARAGALVGGAAWEEILFRLALYPALLVLLSSTARFLGASGALARWLGEALALTLSSLAFAACHLAALTVWLGPGGEAFDPLVFTWRALAGMLFCGLFRWRGLGVAAWAHALFDLALLLGAGPEVFLLGSS